MKSGIQKNKKFEYFVNIYIRVKIIFELSTLLSFDSFS